MDNMDDGTLDLKARSDGVLLPVQAQPGARRNGLIGIHAGRLKVAVTQVAEKGKANREILNVLVEALGIKASAVELLSGGTSAKKAVLLRGMKMEDVAERVRAAVGAAPR
jgi:uncharacterized protein (TIGR00251 family)